MTIQEIKSLLPDGSYRKIAATTGKSYGTINQFFNDRINARVSEKTKAAILLEARKIIKENSLNGLELLYGVQKVNELKEALAA